MSWTKREIITVAFGELGLARDAADLTADELQSAMYRLDAMMAEWVSHLVIFDPVYPLPATRKGGDLDDETNAPDSANRAMYLNLAVEIAPGYGKTPSPDTKKNAADAYKDLAAKYIVIGEMSLAGAVMGSGHKKCR